MTTKKKVTKKKVSKKATVKKKPVTKKVVTADLAIPCNSKYSHKLRPVILNLARQGKTNLEIAELLDISEKTFYNWLELYMSELLQPLKLSKKEKLIEVEKSLFERATGYSTKETKTHLTKAGSIKTVDVIKHYPPDITAQKYYLGNIDPENWKDKREVIVDDSAGRPKKTFAFALDEKPATGEEE